MCLLGIIAGYCITGKKQNGGHKEIFTCNICYCKNERLPNTLVGMCGKDGHLLLLHDVCPWHTTATYNQEIISFCFNLVSISTRTVWTAIRACLWTVGDEVISSHSLQIRMEMPIVYGQFQTLLVKKLNF